MACAVYDFHEWTMRSRRWSPRGVMSTWTWLGITTHACSRYRSPSKYKSPSSTIWATRDARRRHSPWPASMSRSIVALRRASAVGDAACRACRPSASTTCAGSESARRKVTIWVISSASKCGRYPRECQPRRGSSSSVAKRIHLPMHGKDSAGRDAGGPVNDSSKDAVETRGVSTIQSTATPTHPTRARSSRPSQPRAGR